ncbi:hypothetical protein ILUMI_15758 [Ignelater luminosus]|uniref:Uncharacterized protein n=1 Tax=Ignelater luminosus TaxID=2038154 RepID=A0A8K0G3K0_IGNLU|nr:hypothetical protein ILUMI_15758 [Ignelater luminosus]
MKLEEILIQHENHAAVPQQADISVMTPPAEAAPQAVPQTLQVQGLQRPRQLQRNNGSLYVDFCRERSTQPVSKTKHKEMLISKDIGFYVPRKDQCWCYEFDLKTTDKRKNTIDLIKTEMPANRAKK